MTRCKQDKLAFGSRDACSGQVAVDVRKQAGLRVEIGGWTVSKKPAGPRYMQEVGQQARSLFKSCGCSHTSCACLGLYTAKKKGTDLGDVLSHNLCAMVYSTEFL
jgi:hypothetical protein